MNGPMSKTHEQIEQCRNLKQKKTRQTTVNTDEKDLKMIGKGFVLFKINSSPSAFYIIKPTCIS